MIDDPVLQVDTRRQLPASVQIMVHRVTPREHDATDFDRSPTLRARTFPSVKGLVS